jgi:hypothetical protein
MRIPSVFVRKVAISGVLMLYWGTQYVTPACTWNVFKATGSQSGSTGTAKPTQVEFVGSTFSHCGGLVVKQAG